MFGAIARWVKALGYLLTGQIDSARRTLDTNPHVMRARYDEIVREKTGRIQQYKQAVASLIAQRENKVEKIKNLTEEVNKLENLKAGALTKARTRVKELQAQGLSKDQIQQDAERLYDLFQADMTGEDSEVEPFSTEEKFRVAVDLINVNYRVSIPEANLLGLLTLGRDRSGTLEDVLGAVIDLPTILAFMKQQTEEKKRLDKGAGDIASTEDGSED